MKPEALVPGQADPACPITRCLAVIGDILFMVAHGANRFGTMRRAALGCTTRVSTQPRETESDGLLHREIFPEILPREHSRTAARA